jgi:hypothetical protein
MDTNLKTTNREDCHDHIDIYSIARIQDLAFGDLRFDPSLVHGKL